MLQDLEILYVDVIEEDEANGEAEIEAEQEDDDSNDWVVDKRLEESSETIFVVLSFSSRFSCFISLLFGD
uniref:Candidate secreted effector n=1 Tax=Meloidogyne incognita TaxID=6306 RepID=A0A914MZ06_MELIC